jgi:hypothetical protein
MDQDKKLITDFWCEFDKSFLSDPEMLKAKGILEPYVKLKDSFLFHYRKWGERRLGVARRLF